MTYVEFQAALIAAEAAVAGAAKLLADLKTNVTPELFAQSVAERESAVAAMTADADKIKGGVL